MNRHQRPEPQHMRLKFQSTVEVFGELEELELMGLQHRLELKSDLAKLAPIPRFGEAIDLAKAAKAIKARVAASRALLGMAR